MSVKKTVKERTKITITVDKKVINALDNYIEDKEIYNKSKIIENMIKKQIEIDKNAN